VQGRPAMQGSAVCEASAVEEAERTTGEDCDRDRDRVRTRENLEIRDFRYLYGL
jgi:hypothetical protein